MTRDTDEDKPGTTSASNEKALRILAALDELDADFAAAEHERLLELGRERITGLPPEILDEMAAFIKREFLDPTDEELDLAAEKELDFAAEREVEVSAAKAPAILASSSQAFPMASAAPALDPAASHLPNVPSFAAESAATRDNVYDLRSFDREELKRRRLRSVWLSEISRDDHSERHDRKTATRSRSIDEASLGSWELADGPKKIKARGDRHRADFTWVGIGLEAKGVVLFVDGVRIEDVELDLRADANSMRLFFVLPDHTGNDAPLVREETCLEEDGTVRIQLWTTE